MRIILSMLIIMPAMCLGQRSHTYFNIEGEMFNYSHADPSYGGTVSIGGKGKYIGAGAGVGVISLAGSNSPYVPVFFELSAYSNKREVKPFLNIQIGYGIYSDDNNGLFRETGGLYFRPGAGLMAPIGKRTDFLLKGSYVSSQFNTQTSTGQHIGDANAHGWTLSAGFKF